MSTPSSEPFFLSLINKELEKEQKRGNTQISIFSRGEVVELKPIAGYQAVTVEVCKLIRGAESSVCMHFYKIDQESDEWKQIIKALTALRDKAQQSKHKITARLIINSREGLAKIFYKKSKTEGLDLFAQELQSDFFNFEIAYGNTSGFGTYHAKYVISDSQTAIMRSGDPDDYNDNFNRYDIASEFGGTIVTAMLKEFATTWNQIKTTEQTLMDSKIAERMVHKPQVGEIPCLYIAKAPADTIKAPSFFGPCKIALLAAIDHAKGHVDIMTPNLNDPDIIMALARAANRGIQINILFCKYGNAAAESLPTMGGSNYAAMTKLVSSVDRDHLPFLQITWFLDRNGKHPGSKSYDSIHAKYASIDDQLTIVGSSPLDLQGMYSSREADLVFEDHDKTVEFKEELFTKKFEHGIDYFDDASVQLRDFINREILVHETSSDIRLRNLGEKMRSTFTECSRSLWNDSVTYFIHMVSEMFPLFNQSAQETMLSMVESFGINKNLILKSVQQEMVTFSSSSETKSTPKAKVTSSTGVTLSQLSLSTTSEAPSRQEVTKPPLDQAQDELGRKLARQKSITGASSVPRNKVREKAEIEQGRSAPTPQE